MVRQNAALSLFIDTASGCRRSQPGDDWEGRLRLVWRVYSNFQWIGGIVHRTDRMEYIVYIHTSAYVHTYVRTYIASSLVLTWADVDAHNPSDSWDGRLGLWCEGLFKFLEFQTSS